MIMKKITPLQYAIFLYEITSRKTDIKKNIRGFIEILAKNNELGLVNKIIEEFEAYEKRMKGIYDVEIASAKPLESGIKKQVIDSLKNYGKIEIKESVNPDLIGGLTLTVGDMMVDGSLRSRVAELKKALS